jgi:hypothetical protein
VYRHGSEQVNAFVGERLWKKGEKATGRKTLYILSTAVWQGCQVLFMDLQGLPELGLKQLSTEIGALFTSLLFI